MDSKDIFESAKRPSGDLAGVFEFDGETGYFYLYKTKTPGDSGQKVLEALHVMSGVPDFSAKDIAICWDRNETMVGLFIHSKLWAVFDSAAGKKYGGNYNARGQPNIPLEISNAFEK